MGLYNFQPRFAPWILDGSKQHTIRAPRRHPDRPGSIMHLYTGLRQPGARLLFRAPCRCVQAFALTEDGRALLDGRRLGLDPRNAMAWADGFRPIGSSQADPGCAFALMLSFWRDGSRLPFEGHLYHWSYEDRTP